MRDRIFKSSPIHASVVISFPEFSSAPFRKNSTVSLSPLHLHKFNLRNNGTQILPLTTHSPFVRKHRKSYALKENKYSILTAIMILNRCKDNSHVCIEHAQQHYFQVKNKPNLKVPVLSLGILFPYLLRCFFILIKLKKLFLCMKLFRRC